MFTIPPVLDHARAISCFRLHPGQFIREILPVNRFMRLISTSMKLLFSYPGRTTFRDFLLSQNWLASHFAGLLMIYLEIF